MVVKLTKYGNMDVMLRRGAFMPKEADDPGEVYYIQTPESIQIAPHESYIIDTGIYVNLPDGCEGYLIPRSELGICTVIDKTYVGRVDGTGNESIRVSMHGGNTGKYVYNGDVIGKLVILPAHTQENDNDMTKVNRIEIRKAPKSGRQYLILYAKSKGTECDETVILGDDGYPAKISRDIVESLELVDFVHTMKEIEYFSKNTGTQNKLLNHNDDINNDQHTTSVYKLEIRRALSGKQYLVLCTKDGYAILDDDGYLEKLSTDIVESLTLVENLYTTLFYDREF